MSILLLLALSLAGPPGTMATAGGGCPPAHPNAAQRVQNLLASPLLPEMRARYDLGTASASDIRLLTNQRDRETCRALRAALDATGTDLAPGDRVSFYRSGDTFFVPISRNRRPGRPGVISLDGYSSVDVYDAEFRLVGRFGA
jgi:hypothetical protein